MFEDFRTPSLLDHPEAAIVDSGCKGHFLLVNASCRNKTKSTTPLHVRLPNGDTMESTHTASLDIPELREAVSVSHVFPDIANNALLSVGQLRNDGYSVTFKIEGVTFYNTKGKAILKEQCDVGTCLWRLNLRS
jgi:hypothetical protein